MELVVRHQTTYRYATPASQVALLLRLQPAVLDGQAPGPWEVSVNGAPVRAFLANAFGDGEAFFLQRGPVAEVVIVAAGRVETRDRAGVVSGFRQEPPQAVFLRQTALTRPGAAIAALARSAEGPDALATLHALSGLVRERVDYASGSTSMASTAEDALAQGQGVCQDHAHLFVSAARILGHPARYVAGYLLAGEGLDALHETHAWAEAWVAGLGWIGFDCTNGLCVTEHYVRLCCGLDAQDASPVRGSVYGASAMTIHADVRIAEGGPDVPQQMQQQQ
jgi:transglutaminase-like putative cysteine protease